MPWGSDLNENQSAQHTKCFSYWRKIENKKYQTSTKNNTNSKTILINRWMKGGGRYNALKASNLWLFMFFVCLKKTKEISKAIKTTPGVVDTCQSHEITLGIGCSKLIDTHL